MRRRIWSKILAIVLSAAVFLPSLTGSFVASAASNDTITDTFDSGAGNWDVLMGEGELDTSEAGVISLPKHLQNEPLAYCGLKNYPDLSIKRVSFDLNAKLQGAANILLGIIYYYEDENNYKTIGFRETGAGRIYHADVTTKTNGTSPSVVGDMTVDKMTLDGQAPVKNQATNYMSDLQTGGTITLTYTKDIIYVNVKNSAETGDGYSFRITSTDPDIDFTATKRVALAHMGQDPKGTASWIKVDSASYTFDGQLEEVDPQKEADAYKAVHAEILAKNAETVAASDKAAVDAALLAFEGLSAEVKALLTAEKANLDAMKARINDMSQATGGYFEDDFEAGVDNWEAVKEPGEGWGVVDNPNKTELNTSNKVFLPMSIPNPANPNNPWQGGWSFAANGEEGHFPVFALKDGILPEGQKIASVSGDLYAVGGGWNSSIMLIYWYKDAANYKAICIQREPAPDTHGNKTNISNGYAVRRVVYSSTANAYEASAIKPTSVYNTAAGSNFSNIPSDPSEWTHFVFDYAEDGSYCTFTLMDAYGNAETFMLDQDGPNGQKKEEVVDLTDGQFAISTLAFPKASQQWSYIDNISFNFAGSAKDAAECFKAEYARTIYMNTNTLIPEDKPVIAAAVAAYNKLNDDVKAFLGVEQGKLRALVEAVNQWNGNMAVNYRTIHAEALKENASRSQLEAAWNVLLRLPAATQAALKAEKATLQNALASMAGTGTKKPIEIACVGDSITWGSGAANATTDNWPKQLGEMLGSNFVVRNYGVAGIQTVHIYDQEIPQMGPQGGNNLQLENTRTDAWANSHVTQPDVVIVMLGTNDAGKVCGTNLSDEVKAAAKQTYKEAMKALVRSYQALPSSPAVVIATSPVRRLPEGADSKLTNAYYAQEGMYEVQKELIAELGLPSIDIYEMTKAWETEGTTDQYFNADSLHFVKDGYTEFAKEFKAFFDENLKVGFQTDNGGLTYVYFEETAEPEGQVTGVTVAPTDVVVHVGKTQTLQAEVAGTGNYSKAVTWSVAGNTSASTKVVGGVLTVGADETAATLTVTATSVGDTTKSATAKVTVEQHDFNGVWKTDENGHWHECACGAKDEVAAHTFGEWTVTKEATETEKGSKERVCTACAYKETEEIPALEHKHQYGAEWKSDGTNHWHECSCGAKDGVAAHTYGDWTVIKEATETEKGSKERACTVCAYKETEEIPVLSHTHQYGDEWKSDGTNHWHECACGAKDGVAAHTFGDWKVTKEATETEKGSRERSCTVCAYKETEEIPVLEHEHQYGEEWKSDGTNHWHECACGGKDGVAAHTYGDWTVTREATEMEEGSRERSCSVCAYKETEKIPATGSTTDPGENNPDDSKPSDGKDTPKTGDTAPVGLLVAIMVLCAGIIAIVAVRRRKETR